MKYLNKILLISFFIFPLFSFASFPVLNGEILCVNSEDTGLGYPEHTNCITSPVFNDYNIFLSLDRSELYIKFTGDGFNEYYVTDLNDEYFYVDFSSLSNQYLKLSENSNYFADGVYQVNLTLVGGYNYQVSSFYVKNGLFYLDLNDINEDMEFPLYLETVSNLIIISFFIGLFISTVLLVAYLFKKFSK